MKIQYVSETLDKTFDSEEECLAAERELAAKQLAEKVKAEQKAERYKEVKEAFNKYNEVSKKAFKEYEDLAEKFIEDYGSIKLSWEDEEETTSKDVKPISSMDVYNRFFNYLFK